MLLVDKAFKRESKFKKQVYVAKIAKERIFKPALFKNVQLSGQVSQSIVGGVPGHPVLLLVDQDFRQGIYMVDQVAIEKREHDIVIRKGIVPMQVKEIFYSTTY